MCISMNLLQFFCSQQNFTFVMSSFEGATWPTSHRSNLFMLGSYPCVPLNVLQNQGLLKIFNISDFFPNLSWKVFYFTLFCCFLFKFYYFTGSPTWSWAWSPEAACEGLFSRASQLDRFGLDTFLGAWWNIFIETDANADVWYRIIHRCVI